MAYDSAFNPKGGKTFLVINQSLQLITGGGSEQNTSVRVVNLASTIQRFTYVVAGQTNTPQPSITVTTPTAGAPSANTIAMQGFATEVFSLPANCWVQAATGTGFEMTPGEGY